MWSLAEVQRRMRDAVVTGDVDELLPLLVGGVDPVKRLAIHHRHYEASLVSALVGRFPATGWLVGSNGLEDAATQFVHRHPPTAPCVAEYGRLFPTFLATWPATEHLSYLPGFADLDWHLGRLAASTDEPTLTREQFATIDPADLADANVTIQSGTHYLHARWPIDELITLYLTDAAPDSWTLLDQDVWLEARGARGACRFSRLGAADYAWRLALAEGCSLGGAVRRALDVDAAFDVGMGLAALMNDGLLTSIGPTLAGETS